MGCGCDKMVVRGYSKLDQRLDRLQSCSALTGRQTAVIKNNWQILKEHLANIGVATFIG